MKKSKKIIALALCVLVLVLPILSECFIASNRKHSCTGQHCSVCLEIHMAEQIIMTLKTILLSSALLVLILGAFALSRLYQKQIHRVGDTLITLKVELLI